MDRVLGYVLSCRACACTFVICKSCYRGHRYCSDDCRSRGYKQIRQKARQKFESSSEARLDHRDRSQKYRDKLKDSINGVTDQTSKPAAETINTHPHERLVSELRDLEGVCCSCGTIVFPRGVHVYGGPV